MVWDAFFFLSSLHLEAMTPFARDIILASSADGPITAYDPITGTVLARFSRSCSPRKGLTLVGATLIAVSHVSTSTCSGFIRLFNWCSSAPVHCIPLPEPVAPLVATPDGSYLFCGGLSGRIHALSLPSADVQRSFHAHRQPVSCLTVSDDASLLVSGCDDGTIATFPILRLLDVAFEGDEDDAHNLALYRIPAHSLSVTGIASGPGGCNARILSSSLDCTCKLWRLADGVCLHTVTFARAIWSVVMDATNSEAYAGGSDGQVYVVQLKAVRGGRVTAQEAEVSAWVSDQTGAVTAVAMANGNRNLVSVTEDGVVTIRMAENGSVVRVLTHAWSSISEIVIANAGIARSVRPDCVGFIPRNAGFYAREIGEQVRETEEWLGVATQDRTRAIATLEAAIKTYEGLLRLLLREAKAFDGKEEASTGNASLR